MSLAEDTLAQQTIVLLRAKRGYTDKLAQIDKKLAMLVSVDPTALTDAQALQDEYVTDIAGETLAANAQPGEE